MYKYALIFLATFFTIISCKKNETTSSQLTLNSTNIAGTYKMSAATFSPSGSTTEYDVYTDTTILKTCKKDDYYIFDVKDSFTYKDTGIFCVPPTNYKVKYTITQPDKLNYNNKDYTVNSLTSTKLIISSLDSFSLGTVKVSGTAKITLTRQ